MANPYMTGGLGTLTGTDSKPGNYDQIWQEELARRRAAEVAAQQGAPGIQPSSLALNVPTTSFIESPTMESPDRASSQESADQTVDRTFNPSEPVGPGSKDKGGGSGMDQFSGIVNAVHTIVGDMYSSADWWKKLTQDEPLARKQYDEAFFENKRKWNLEYALNEWAQRKRISLEEAKQLFYQRMQEAEFDINKLAQQENILTARENRQQSQYKFAQQKQSDASRRNLGGKIVKALVKGLTAGRPVATEAKA